MDYRKINRKRHEERRLLRYADELVHITQELRRAADVIEMVESEPALIGALMDSGDWRIDEITQLRRHVADLRARIGNY
jgi:ubiquinone biosynthesis protein UbiJ